MTTRFVSRSSGGQEVPEPDDLLDDLPLGQVPLDPLQPAGAEDAPHPAADLRADADGPPVVLGHQDALDPPAAVGASSRSLSVPSGRGVVEVDGRGEDGPLGVQLLAEGEWEVGHRARPLASAYPAQDLRLAR